METMLKFNRLKQITEDCEVIVAAIKKSTSGLMEVQNHLLSIKQALANVVKFLIYFVMMIVLQNRASLGKRR